MTIPVDKSTALACHPAKKVNRTEEFTYLSTNIGYYKASDIVFGPSLGHLGQRDRYRIISIGQGK